MNSEIIVKAKLIEKKLKQISKDRLINPKIAEDLILIAQQKYKQLLSEVYDNCFHNILSDNQYSEFVLYSYKSYFGEIPAQTSYNNQLFRRRLNLFKKGKRWSDHTGHLFYSFLDKLSDKFGEIPINLIGELCSKKNIRKIIIKTSRTASISEGVVYFPCRELTDKVKIDGDSLSALLRNYIDCLSNNSQEDKISRLINIEEKIDGINQLKLIEEIKKARIINDFAINFKNVFNLTQEEFENYKEKIYISFLLYQYNDLEFDLHLFFPNSGAFLSVLMIAIRPNKSLPTNIQHLLLEAIDELKYLEKFEREVVEKTRLSNETYIIWKNIYEREYDKLYTFVKSVENICYSICKQYKISFSHKDGRVKTFESLYNKIYIRANDPKENNKFNAKYGITYKDAIYEPHRHYSKVFSIVKDLAGVRIVLLFEDDLNRIKQIFDSLNISGDLKLKEIKFYKQCNEDEDDNVSPEDKVKIYNYRSLHLIVQPGINRLKLLEYQNLSDVQCEIQFRSVLAHAWADVNHDLDYKNREVIKAVLPAKQNVLKKDFRKLSKNLFENDKFLNSIKEKGKSIQLD